MKEAAKKGGEAASQPDYRTFIWVELLAFDPKEKDFGVGKYLDGVGFKLDGILFDIRYSDFSNEHERNIDDTPLDYKYCANYERPGWPMWTRRQLRGLVETLKKNGVTAYFSQMPTLGTTLRPDFKPLETSLKFIRDKHPELIGRGARGELQGCITMLKRLKDGRFYEDFFTAKLGEIIEDYGFGGFFAADAMIHLYGPVLQHDFSDDMVAQFIEATGAELPPHLRGKFDDNPELFDERLEWIRAHHPLEWIRFYAKRWAGFLKKVVEVCHARGAKVIANDAIQNDPFQALYRFGCDYREVAETGIDGMVLQTNAGSAELLLGFSDRKVNHDWVEKMVADILVTKACVPNLPLYFLCCIQDGGEKWDTLRYAPALLEKEILSYTATYYVDGDHSVRHCLDGPVFCLGDGISHDEWKWLKDKLDLGFSTLPASANDLPGLTAVWVDEAVDNQLKARCGEPKDMSPPAHRLLWDMLSAGLPVRSILRYESIPGLERLLLLPNPAYADEKTLKTWRKWKERADTVGVEVGLLNEITSGEEHPIAELRIIRDDGSEIPWARIYAGGLGQDTKDLSGAYHEEETDRARITTKCGESPGTVVAVPARNLLKRMSAEFPGHWGHSIPFDEIPVRLLESLATISKSFDGLEFHTTSGRSFVIKTSPGTFRLYITNEEAFYEWAGVHVKKELISVKTLTGFPKVPILHDGHEFLIQIPPLGIALLEIETSLR